MAVDAGLVEFLQEYVSELADLMTPVKSKINSLTMLAAEEAAVSPAAAFSIAAAIEKRISSAPPASKLPALFLLDSIVKNAKQPFIQIFARNLPQMFHLVWEAAPAQRQALQRMLDTWNGIFPPQPLDIIRHRSGLAPELASQQQQQQHGFPPPMQRDPATFAAPQFQQQPEQQLLHQQFLVPQPLPQPEPQQQFALQPEQQFLVPQQEPATIAPAQQGEPQLPPQQQPPTGPVLQPPVEHHQEQTQQLPAPLTLPAPHAQPAQAAPAQQQLQLGNDQLAALRKAAAARLAARRPTSASAPASAAPLDVYKTRLPQRAAHSSRPAAKLPAATAAAPRAGAGRASARFREYEPASAGLHQQPGALQPQQFAQLQALLQSIAPLAQAGAGLGGGLAAAAPWQPQPATPRRPLEELWSPAVLRERDPNVIQELLDASKDVLAAQLDRAFAARRRAKARGDAKPSRPWWPTEQSWVAGAAPPAASPAAAFGQLEEQPEETVQTFSVPADDSQTQCALSGEKFETFWDDELQQWRYKDARRLEAREAERYGLSEGSIVLVSAVGPPPEPGMEAEEAVAVEADTEAEDVKPAVAGGADDGNAAAVAADLAAAATAEQHGGSGTEEAAAAAAAGAAAAAAPVVEEASIDAAADADQKASPPAAAAAHGDDQPHVGSKSIVAVGDSAEAVAEVAPAAAQISAVSHDLLDFPVRPAQPNGVITGDAEQAASAMSGNKRGLDDDKNEDEPPLKIKRESG